MTSLFYLSCLLWLTAVSAAGVGGGGKGGGEGFLTYNPQDQQLRFQCPEPGSQASGSLLYAQVLRKPKDGNATELAKWTTSEHCESKHDRVRVPEEPTAYLDATLEHVTCYDSVTYTCTYQGVTESGVEQSATKGQDFQFIGEISQPIISQEPLKSRYREGEQLILNCSASVGTKDNRIVWEEGFPGGPFSAITGEENPETGKAYEEVQEDPKHCTQQSFFHLKYRVKAEDDGKIFRCRLRRTQQTTSIAIAVETDKKCAGNVGMNKKDPDDPELGTVDLQVTKPESERIVGDRGSDGEEDMPSMSTTSMSLIIVIAVLVVLMAVVVAGVFVLRRQWKKKTLQPVVILETPASSESGYADRVLPSVPSSDRLLPNSCPTLPGLNTDPGRNDTMPKWIADNPHHRHLENRLNNNSNSNNANNHSDLSSASIYVSMSAMDRCSDLETGGDVAQDGYAHVRPDAETEQPEIGDVVPDMRTDRSQSLYSNQAACVDELKGGEGEEEENLYVPNFVELI